MIQRVWIRVTMISVIGLLALVGCGAQPGKVTGVVYQGPERQLAANVQVVVYELKSESVNGLEVYQKGRILSKQLADGNGAFSFSLPPGTYVIEVWIEGLEVASRMVKVKPGRTVTVDLEVPVPAP